MRPSSHHTTTPNSTRSYHTSRPGPSPERTPTNPIPFSAPASADSASSSASSSFTQPDSHTPSPSKRRTRGGDTPIQLQSLSHIVEIAKDDYSAAVRTSSSRGRPLYEDRRRYEISSMPVTDVIEMVAALLSKITSTNDRQHEGHHDRYMPTASERLSDTAKSVMAFHGKNVPSITISNYLGRIHKYCPTTYEVFLSLLVYFDRMTVLVNKSFRHPPAGSGNVSKEHNPIPETPAAATPTNRSSLSHVFVVDSFNIHRLVIAGVTAASKFFSDVFYTNSRYAKVGGLPLAELNHLEMQFLVLNNFRLSVTVEELEDYGTMLVQFYARETIASQNLTKQLLTPTEPNPQQVQVAT
ncbi:cyclin-domain-containing protein [Ascodesmis nigricans]|uniref:Cyclin-domain-containing protein n=1 Tax=Ascodesmis nigricans TaxID=341454 RepID=A0A4S2MHT8_9PEZI|nr:cyclin-domain-containing protein [Ascodesmis nigricans]